MGSLGVGVATGVSVTEDEVIVEVLSGTVAEEVVSEESSFLSNWYARKATTTKTAATKKFLIRLLRLRGPKKVDIV
ncbi:MAG: hypothetical protein CL457_03620 [Acidimicrobiaceae bacterium]|nr:hypothetical protein [Acidimicrobiaceae bacterium]